MIIRNKKMDIVLAHFQTVLEMTSSCRISDMTLQKREKQAEVSMKNWRVTKVRSKRLFVLVFQFQTARKCG